MQPTGRGTRSLGSLRRALIWLSMNASRFTPALSRLLRFSSDVAAAE
jgi:hypothetical protein